MDCGLRCPELHCSCPARGHAGQTVLPSVPLCQSPVKWALLIATFSAGSTSGFHNSIPRSHLLFSFLVKTHIDLWQSRQLDG